MTEATQRIAQVVPDLPTFAVDDGFSYAIPPEQEGISVGSLVRIPLGSRRMRGYVVSIRRGDPAGLKPIVSVSGDTPVFDERLLETLRWAALHYVAPVAVLLGRAKPPNLPRGKGRPGAGDLPELESPLPELSAASAAGRHTRPTCLIASGNEAAHIAGLSRETLAAGRNVAVICPTVDEATAIAETLRKDLGKRVRYVSSRLPAKDATRVWVDAQRQQGLLVVGTPELALWPLGRPALWLVVEEGRRAMKAKQTPTLQVRDLVRRRALVERTAVVFIGAVPTLDTLSRGAATFEPPGRVWPLVEVIDRREDRGGYRVLADRAVTAMKLATRAGGQVFVFVSRRGFAPAFRCVRCRELRRCPECGSGPDRGNTCRRCGTELGPCVACGGKRFEPLGAGVGRVAEEIARHLGDRMVGPPDSGRQVIVGSERDLPAIPSTTLTVIVDADSMLMAPHYRAEEDAYRILVRVAGTVARGRGNRCLIQTAQPEHRALGSLRGGHPLEYLSELIADRHRDGLPPAAELIALEVQGDAVSRHNELLIVADDSTQIHGPELGGGTTRWFLQSGSLQSARVRLRSLVQQWRDSGLKVRVDADPIDL